MNTADLCSLKGIQPEKFDEPAKIIASLYIMRPNRSYNGVVTLRIHVLLTKNRETGNENFSPCY